MINIKTAGTLVLRANELKKYDSITMTEAAINAQ